MKRRCLVFVTALILATAMLLSPAGADCDHYDERGNKLSVVRGRVAPGIGVPGYSGDEYCSRCGALLKKGEVLPALEESAGPSDGTTKKPETQPPATEKPETTVKPEKPAKPEQPMKTEPPVKTEKPVKPEKPKKTEKPEKTKKPKEKATEKLPEVVRTPQGGGPEKTAKPTAKPNNGSKKKKADEKMRWEPFSRDYPFRRMKMKPKKGIRAEAAGTPVWPAASPFQGMIGE